MPRPLPAMAADRLRRPWAAVVTCLRLEPYTDRAAGTKGPPLYFATRGCSFTWPDEGSPVLHRAALRSVGAFDEGGPFLPSGQEEDIPLRTLELGLRPDLYGELRALNLENADAVVAQVPAEAFTGAFSDLSDSPGVIGYRGRVAVVGPVDESEIVLGLEQPDPEIEWRRAADPTEADPGDVGARYPLPVGLAPRVPLIGRRVGWVTTLAENLSPLDVPTTLALSDATGLESGAVLIAQERFEYTGKSGNTLTGVTRNAPVRTNHTAGDAVVEVSIAEAVWVAADRPIRGVADVECLNPYNGLWTRIPELYTVDLADTATDPGATLSTLKLPSAELEQVIDFLAQGTVSVDTSLGPGDFTIVEYPDLTLLEALEGTAGENDRTAAPFTATGAALSSFTGWGYAQAYRRIRGGFSPHLGVNRQKLAFTYNVGGGSAVLVVTVFPDASYTNGIEVYRSRADAGVGGHTVLLDFGAAGADHRFFEIDAQGSQDQDVRLYDFHRLIHSDDADVVPQAVAITFGGEGNKDNAGAGFQTDRPSLYDGNVGTYWTTGADADDEFRFQLAEPFQPTAYVVRISAGAAQDSGQPSTGPIENRRWWQGYLATVEGLNSTGGAGTPDPDRYWNVLEGMPIADPDQGGGRFDMFDAGYGIQWDATDGYVEFWFDATHAAAQGHDCLAFRQVRGSSNNALFNITVERLSTEFFQGDIRTVSANVGYGLRLRATLDGVPVPAGYPVAQGERLEHAADVVRWVIEELGGQSVDPTTYAAARAALDLPAGLRGPDAEVINTVGTIFTVPYVGAEFDALGIVVGVTVELTLGAFSQLVTVDSLTTGSTTTDVTCLETIDNTYSQANALIDTSVSFAGDLRTCGNRFRELLARVAFEARISPWPVERDTGTVWLLLAPAADFTWPGTPRRIAQHRPRGISELGRRVGENLFTRYTFTFDLDPTAGPGDEAFRGRAQASADGVHDLTTVTAGDLAAAEQVLGSLVADPRAFLLLRRLVDVDPVAGYGIATPLGLPLELALADVPWWLAFDLELGDLIEVQPSWHASPLRLRVIGHRKDPSSETVTLNALEVDAP